MLSFLRNFGNHCDSGGFFDFPTWYKYIDSKLDDQCEIITSGDGAFKLMDIWGIVAAVIEMAIYVAGVIAVVMIIWGGFRFITSQGSPDTIKQARETILYAVIGLVVSISARAIMNVVAGVFA